jgi:hypothetical protein
LTTKVTICTDGVDALSEQFLLEKGDDAIINVDKRRITKLQKGKATDSEVIVHFEDGTSVSEGFIVRFALSVPFSIWGSST